MVIQLKSRYDDINRAKKFMVGVDRPKMKLYDVDASVYAGKSDEGNKKDDRAPWKGGSKKKDAEDKPLNSFGRSEPKRLTDAASKFDFSD